jgi:TAZ zinc finger
MELPPLNDIMANNVEYLVHASQCISCEEIDCMYTKLSIVHDEMCKKEIDGEPCIICTTLNKICVNHAIRCTIENCTVYKCQSIKVIFTWKTIIDEISEK